MPEAPNSKTRTTTANKIPTVACAATALLASLALTATSTMGNTWVARAASIHLSETELEFQEPVTLMPRANKSKSLMSSHRSHRSHSSHRSHYSSRSPAPRPTTPTTTPVTPPTTPKITPQPKEVDNSIYDLLLATNASHFARKLIELELDSRLRIQGTGSWTVFAPVSIPGWHDLDKPEQTLIAKHHIARGKHTVEAMLKHGYITMSSGQRITVDKLSDGTITMGGKKVTLTSMKCKNGLLYLIGNDMEPSLTTLLEELRDRGTHDIFLELLERSEVIDLVEGSIPLTLLAPSDSAFQALQPDKLLRLDQASKDQLASIMKRTIVAGRFYADQSGPQLRQKSLNGQTVSFESRNEVVRACGSIVEETDIDTSNGVLHLLKSAAILFE